MVLPVHIAGLSDQADELLDVLEKAASSGFAGDVMREVADAGGLGTPEIITAARKRWRDYQGRGRVSAAVEPGTLTVMRQRCDELARAVCERSKPPQLAHLGLASESIFTAIVIYTEARGMSAQAKRGRGKPSELTRKEAADLIAGLADIWLAFTGRTPRAGDGDTKANLNFNMFVQRAFQVAGVSANAYSLPKVIKRALT